MEVARMCLASLVLFTSVRLATSSDQCFDKGAKKYELAWAAQGSTFFDEWDFGEQDFTNGVVRYVGRQEAHNNSLVEAHATHAIARGGKIERGANGVRRKSVRLSSQKNFQYFLAAIKFSHTPYGCGVWPAFWSNGASGNWPKSGELDILEYWNDKQSEVSFHTAISDKDGCELDKAQLRKKGCPLFNDVNNVYTPWRKGYDCQTDYNVFPPRLGCAPTSDNYTLKTGKEYSDNPGVMAAEWTKEYIKVFYIPEAQIPKDLEAGAPKPDTWDEFIISYYPFAASEKASPGSCPLTGQGVSSAQSFVLNIELCGGRGSSEFPLRCKAHYWDKCLPKAYAGKGDCCTEYMLDENRSDANVADSAFFNISYVKVWQHKDDETATADIVV